MIRRPLVRASGSYLEYRGQGVPARAGLGILSGRTGFPASNTGRVAARKAACHGQYLLHHAALAMWLWMDRIAVTLFDATLSTCVFLTIIVLAMLACRQPARRILLARVALLASLAILPLIAFGRLPRLYVVDAFVESRFFPKALFQVPEPGEAAGLPTDAIVAGIDPDHLVPQWIAESESAAAYWLPRGLTFIDLACVGVGAAWLLLGIAGVQWLIHRSREPSEATQELFDEILAARPTGATWTGLRVRVCPRLHHPVVTGLFRPTILIPESLDRDDGAPGALRLSLLHEIAHAEASDHWFSTAASAAQALWFFLPHVWWIRSQLLIDQEFLADRAAAEQYGTSSEYASSLLSMAAPGAPQEHGDEPEPTPEPSPPARGSGRHSPLFQRMVMLLHCPYPVESRTPRLWSWTLRLAVVAVSLIAACLVIRWPHIPAAVGATPNPSAASPRFQVTHFVAEPLRESPSSSRSLVYVMPLALPPVFELHVDVLCRSADLQRVRVAGHPLASPHTDSHSAANPGGPAVQPDDFPTWRHIHLLRNRDSVVVEINGIRLPEIPHDEHTSKWLTFEPPSERPAEFRDLVISW